MALFRNSKVQERRLLAVEESPLKTEEQVGLTEWKLFPSLLLLLLQLFFFFFKAFAFPERESESVRERELFCLQRDNLGKR